MFKIIITFIACLLLSSCFLHVQKIPVQQGNVITKEAVSQLQIGMTESEVRNVMGNPVILNVFTPDRIEYVYTYQRATEPRQEQKVSCIFENGRLAAIEKML